MTFLKTPLAACALVATLALSGCLHSGIVGAVPEPYLTGTTLDRNAITVSEKTEYLEVYVYPQDARLPVTEQQRIRQFTAGYRQHGHGPLTVSLPSTQVKDPQAIRAVNQVREVAWGAGVNYEDMQGGAYDPQGQQGAPLLLTYSSYDAVAPTCLQKSAYDFNDASSNNDMPSLGCSVRTNMAAMIAEPYDLWGDRPLDAGDITRRQNQLELYRNGQPTGAERSDQENGSVSTAVN